MDVQNTIFLYIVIGLLVVILAGFIVHNIILQRNLNDISNQLKMILDSETNQRITVSTNNKGVLKLVEVINSKLKTLRDKEINYLGGSQELRQSIVNVSHDLRTPLTAINAYLDIIEDEKDQAIIDDYLKRIRNRIEALNSLTEELFSFVLLDKESKPADKTSYKAKFDNTNEATKIIALLQECMLDFYAAFKERNIEPSISDRAQNLDENSILVAASRKSVLRIFENVISNALKYGKNIFEVDYFINDKGNIQIEFVNESDRLTNISLSKLFDKYYTVEEGKESTGLGLLIAKKMAEEAGGSIGASLEGERFRITIVLPIELKEEK